jgi:signal transduction histidine kinase
VLIVAFHGIKTNIAVNLAILLAVAMLLADIIMVITAQRDLVQSEVSKGNLIISEIENNLLKTYDGSTAFLPGYEERLSGLLKMAGFSCAVVHDKNSEVIYSSEAGCLPLDEVRALTKQSVESSKKITRFTGTAWGVLWMQDRYLIISAPLFKNGKVEGGAGIVLELERIYKGLRRSQEVLFVYLVVNLFILTVAGLYLISNIAVKPVQRMARRAEEFRGEDELFFLYGNKENEFDKLSKALNRLLKRISGDKEKLQASVRSLEKVNIELKQAEKDVVRAEKMASVGRLSSGIAHEIGNPIGIVIGYLELLKQKDIPDDEKNEYLNRAGDEINRISIIIRQLLDYSRQSDEKPEIIGVHEVIKDVSDIVKYQPFMTNIEIRLSLEAENDNILADSNQLRQIFLNLIINAADAISSSQNEQSGRLMVASEVIKEADPEAINSRPTLKISFADNGAGIPEESIGNIFDPFYTTKEPGKGTGLGLFVCFSLIDGMGGKIKAQSSGKEGTRMIIYLPLHEKSIL